MKTFDEIKRTRNHFTFVWALQNLMSMGIDDAKEITDEEIEKAYKDEQIRQENMDGICWYTPEVVRDMVLTTRELASCEFNDLMNGIVKADLWHAYPISWDRMNEIANNLITHLIDDGMYDANEYFKDEVELEDDEIEWFGIEQLYEEGDEDE